jgi:hypothetical protein
MKSIEMATALLVNRTLLAATPRRQGQLDSIGVRHVAAPPAVADIFRADLPPHRHA